MQDMDSWHLQFPQFALEITARWSASPGPQVFINDWSNVIHFLLKESNVVLPGIKSGSFWLLSWLPNHTHMHAQPTIDQ